MKSYLLPHKLPELHKQEDQNACAVYSCIHALEYEYGLKNNRFLRFNPELIFYKIQQMKWGIFDKKRSLALVEVLAWLKQEKYIVNYMNILSGDTSKSSIIKKQLLNNKPVIVTRTRITNNRITICHALCVVGWDVSGFKTLDSLGRNLRLQQIKNINEITEAYCLFV